MAADLAAWHETPSRKGLTAAIAAVAVTASPLSVLDVGAGLGRDLKAIDCRSKWAVEPNDALRADLDRQGVITAATIDELQAFGFDLILCIDVLEHVPDPDALVEAMIARLQPDGLLIERTSTDDDGTPLHLEALRHWSPEPILRKHGFSPRWQVDAMIVWQRFGEKVQQPSTVLLCAYRSLSVETAECLTELGWPFAIHRGDALISRVRSKAVSQWMQTTDEDVFLMVDDDIVFRSEDAAKVVELAREKRGIACGAYPVGDGGHLACRALVPGETIVFGDDAPPKEILWAATGFMAAHREVCEKIAATLPQCEARGGYDFWPMFMPSIKTGEDGRSVYLSEDYAFCERARDLGYQVWLDPSVILGHFKLTPVNVYNMPTTKLVERIS